MMDMHGEPSEGSPVVSMDTEDKDEDWDVPNTEDKDEDWDAPGFSRVRQGPPHGGAAGP
jgi:hypothetical protein